MTIVIGFGYDMAQLNKEDSGVFNRSVRIKTVAITALLLFMQPFGLAIADSFDMDHFHQTLREALRLEEQGNFNQAESLFKQALDDARTHNASQHVIANAEGLLGQLYVEMGISQEAEKLLRHALAVMEMEIPPEWQSVANYSNSLGKVYAEQGHHKEALKQHAKVVKLYETYLTNSKTRIWAYPNSLYNLSHDYWELAQYTESQGCSEKALEFAKRHPGKHKLSYANMLLQTSWTYIYQGNYPQAESMIREAVSLLRKSDTVQLTAANSYLGSVLVHEGRYAEAEVLYDKALAVDKVMFGTHHFKYVSDLICKIRLLQEQGKFEQTRALVQEANTLMSANSYPVIQGDLLHALGKLAQFDKEYEVAEQYFNQAIATEKSVSGPIHRHQVRYYAGLAELYVEQGKREAAILNYEAAIIMQQKVAPATHPDLQKLQKNLNGYLAKTAASLPVQQ